jgi:hypothetical protein
MLEAAWVQAVAHRRRFKVTTQDSSTLKDLILLTEFWPTTCISLVTFKGMHQAHSLLTRKIVSALHTARLH